MINGEPNWSKAEWRDAAKAARGPLRTDAEQAQVMVDALLGDILKKNKKAKTVSVYWPVVGEIDTRPLINALHDKGYDVALPRVVGDRRDLEFHLWKKGDNLEAGAFGLMEPPHDPTTLCQPDVHLMPLLAFDEHGHRLGYGKGHYDATLAHGNGVFVGVGFDEQKTAHPLPAEDHDVRLNAVLTPSGAIWFK